MPCYEDPKKVKDWVKMSVILKVAKRLNYMEVYDHAKKDPNHFCDILSKLVCLHSLFAYLTCFRS